MNGLNTLLMLLFLGLGFYFKVTNTFGNDTNIVFGGLAALHIIMGALLTFRVPGVPQILHPYTLMVPGLAFVVFALRH